MSSKTKSSEQKSTRRMVTLWVPNLLNEALCKAVAKKHTDKSKWIREAMREKAAREGIAH